MNGNVDIVPCCKQPVSIDGGLVKEEEKDVGVVAFSVYRSYWYAVGTFLAPLILLSLLLMQGICVCGCVCVCVYMCVHVFVYLCVMCVCLCICV